MSSKTKIDGKYRWIHILGYNIRVGDGNIEYLTFISNKIYQNKDINVEKIVSESFDRI